MSGIHMPSGHDHHMTARQARLLELVDLTDDGRLHIAGIVECADALALIEAGELVLLEGALNKDTGGSGIIRRAPRIP